jgi:hypothetical protein
LNWKETLKGFFKPTKVKIVLFIVILTVSVSLHFFAETCAPGNDCSREVFVQKVLIPIIAPFFSNFIIQNGFIREMELAFLANLIYWWIDSCIIFFIIKKVRK